MAKNLPKNISNVLLALKLSNTVKIIRNIEPIEPIDIPIGPPTLMKFSPNGSLIACVDLTKLIVFETTNFRDIFRIELIAGRTTIEDLAFSPRSSMIAVLESSNFTCKTQNEPNLKIYDLSITHTGTPTILAGLYHNKTIKHWTPIWNEDESLLIKQISIGLGFYISKDFNRLEYKLHIENLENFSISRSNEPYIAVFVGRSKNTPLCSVRIYKYGDWETPISFKAFSGATAILRWNYNYTALLFNVQLDNSQTYYGETKLYYMDLHNNGKLLEMDKKGPIHSFDWNPTQNQFAVIYGMMPSKARVYNQKCEPLLTLPETHLNVVTYNPHGNILCFAGFGGLRGKIEFWHVPNLKKISETEAPDTTYCQWCPDSNILLTATTSPRLYEGNSFKFWSYFGKQLYNFQINNSNNTNNLLWEIVWQPIPHTQFPEPTLSGIKYMSFSQNAQENELYVPPSLRGNTMPKNEQNSVRLDNPIKNKNMKRKCINNVDDKVHQVKEPIIHKQNSIISTEEENLKKYRTIKKKLKDIGKLKQLKEEGKLLDINQNEKIKSEYNLLINLEKLKINIDCQDL